MVTIALAPRPHSCHRPRVAGFEPLISHRITRVAKGGKNSWRCEVLVDGVAMSYSHRPTKAAAQTEAASGMQAYTEAHYFSV